METENNMEIENDDSVPVNSMAPSEDVISSEPEVEPEVVGTEAPENSPQEKAPDPEPEKPTDKELELSEKFNQVTERERVLRDAEEKNKLSADELKSANDILAKFKENPLEGLRALGIDFKDVANLVLNDELPTAEMQVKELRDKMAARDKAFDEKEAKEIQTKHEANEKFAFQEQEKAVTQAKLDIKNIIDGEPEKFELIKSQNAYEMVFDIAGQIFEETKVLPDWDDVCIKVEDQLTKEVEKYFETNKFKSKYQEIPKSTNHDDERDLEANYYAKQMLEEKHGRSLNNYMTSEGAKAPASNDYRTDEESKEYLAAKLTRMLEA